MAVCSGGTIQTFPTAIVWLTNAALVQTLQAQYPNGVNLAPDQAVTQYGAPYGGQTPGGAITPPFTQVLDNQPFNSGFSYDTSVKGSSLVSYNNAVTGLQYCVSYTWIVYFMLYAQGKGAPVSNNLVTPRRWIMGFELPSGGEGLSPLGTSAMASAITRDASRTSEGFGLAMRNAQNVSVQRRLDEYGAPTNANGSWERFYIRLRTAPTADQTFWGTQGGGTGSAADGAYLGITSAGQLRLYNRSIFGGFGTLATISPNLTINKWYRVDIFVFYSTGSPNPGTVDLYLNGVSVASQQVAFLNSGFGGIGRPQNHTASTIGDVTNSSNSLEIDVDDWSNRQPPTNQAGIAAFQASFTIDWNNGSHIRRIKARGVDSQGSWTGDWRETLENPAAGSIGRLTSTTNLDQYSITTDAAAQQAATEAGNGAAAYVVGMYGQQGTGGGSGKLGTTATLIAITQATSDQFNSVLFGSLTNTVDLSLIKPAHQRGTVGGTATLGLLGMSAEYLGVFRPEDVPVGDTVKRSFSVFNLHNAPYPETPWGLSQGFAASEVSIAAGTYTGNNLGQDISTLDPVHWVWIRPLTSPLGGARWIASTTVAQSGGETTPYPDGCVEGFGVNGSYGFRVAGSDSQVNATGVTYQYVAFCDPGLRYSACAACRHSTLAASPIANPMPNGFSPSAVFLHLPSLNLSGARGLWYKGVGHNPTNGEASPINALSTQTGVVDLNSGIVSTYQTAHDGSGGSSNAYIGWTTADTAGSSNICVQICQYTGDGTGQRVINLTPVSGKAPMFALVAPHSGGKPVVCRDPSHTGTNSSNADSFAIVADGIVAGGVDTITVHSDYNANGIVYDVFVLPGCEGTTTFQNGTCVVAAPIGTPPGAPPAPGPPVPPGPPGPTPPPIPPTAPPLPNACAAPILGGGA